MRLFAALGTALVAALLAGACSGKFESASAGAGSTSLDGGQSGGAQGSSGGSANGTGGSRASGGRIGAAGGGTGNVVGSGTGGNVSVGGAGGFVGGGTDGAVVGNGGGVSSDASVGVDGGITPVSCDSPADCPAPGTVCQTAACVGHQCGFVAVPSAVPPENRPGDCKKLVCNQNGAEVAIDDPADDDDGNICTSDACQGGAVIHTVQTGAICPGGFCTPNAVCAPGCTQNSDCPQGATECTKQTCVQGTCKRVPPGTLCNGFLDQCDDIGNCVDCWNSGGCDECCVCLNKTCIPA
jgi:hypothetical protein